MTQPVSLSEIDPRLTDLDNLSHPPTPTQGDNLHDPSGLERDGQPSPQPEPDTGVEDAGNEKGKGKKPLKKKIKGMVPGSTADYKRKEANRLAAERSRSRQAEQRAILHEAVHQLRAEQQKLKADIARLEEEASGSRGAGFTLPQHDQRPDEPISSEMSSTPVLPTTTGDDQVGDESNSAGGIAMTSTEALEAEAEAQAHSRTILAALMSDAEIDQALVGEWMDHVSEAEAGPSTSTPSVPTNLAEQTLLLPERQPPHRETGSPHDETAPTQDTAKPNGLAVALHAEMERYLREDLAATKIAIDQVEQEFLILRGEIERPTLEDGSSRQYVSPLPVKSYSVDSDEFSAVIESLEGECRRVQSTLPELKQGLVKLKDSRIAEAEKLKNRLLDLNIEETDKPVVDKLLKPLSTHLNDLLVGLAPEKGDAIQNFVGYTLGPAIAPRRRGRPPKHPAMARPKPRSNGPPTRKSRLALEVHLDQDAQADQSESLSMSQSQQVHHQQDQGHEHDQDQNQDAHSPTGSQIALANSPSPSVQMTTDELISHLANHDDQSLRDLLTNQLENEYIAQQAMSAQIQSHLDGQPNPLDTPSHSSHHGHGHSQQGQGESSTSGSISNHVVHFKQGPPGSCDICARTQTTVWRKIVVNGEDLHVCNPCGMYHIKTGHIRPPELWGDGKLIRKRRKSTHPRSFKDGAKRFRTEGNEHDNEGDLAEQLGDIEGEVGEVGLEQAEVGTHGEGENVHMSVENLGEVVGHDEFRASLGIEGISEIMKGFGDGVGDVEQDVANVFGTVE